MEVIGMNSLNDLKNAASRFVQLMGEKKVFAFRGSMGSGKTTFIKSVCKELGIGEQITSPSFSLINEYTSPGGNPVYHFDCYRLKNIKEAYDIGAEEYFYSGNICFIEWPEIIEDLLPPDTVNVTVAVKENGERELTLDR
ncbi:MAG: tRNA (adenosine(37)-N6)-threonylcarbamoyltransferase complex ATPase subunit type 1 TsaE [Prolixibacteraceae bacterium]|nr:tRNA (adenosine(37)-N6)-threonylcarbamoyltransferase complex ATPase subunit type 1 TsaE [Prolixibacteraceae bacterium]